MTAKAPLAELAHAERVDLADFLTTLTPAQWQTQSLCAGWTVKDVVAHVVSYEDLGIGGLVKRLVEGRIAHANQIGVDDLSHLSAPELLDLLHRHLDPSGLTSWFGGMIAFVDGTIHHQDIRRALHRPRVIPPDRLSRILPLVPGNPRLGARSRIKGLRLRSTDVDWTHGDGPEVVGAGEALLMAMAGRPAALADLSGPGFDVLAQRLRPAR